MNFNEVTMHMVMGEGASRLMHGPMAGLVNRSGVLYSHYEDGNYWPTLASHMSDFFVTKTVPWRIVNAI